MLNGSHFQRLAEPERDRTSLTIHVDGVAMPARAGDSVAAALLANGLIATRQSAKHKRPRGPYCMMGVCFECLVDIDGRANQQACMVTVVEAMQIRTRQPQALAK